MTVFDTHKGQHVWNELTICEIHRQIYDILALKANNEIFNDILPLLEKAYIAGIKMTKKLVEYKLSLPEWEKHENIKEVTRLRKLRTELNNALSAGIRSERQKAI